MPRKPSLNCRIPGCNGGGACELHTPKPWEQSSRRHRLPSDWNRRRARILRRDPICRSCMAAPSAEVDHVDGTDNHADTNLQGLCKPCHARKTAAEAAVARKRGRRA